MPRALASAIIAALLVSSLQAQNFTRPGLIHLGKGKWGNRAQAERQGFVQYQGRWYPKSMQRKLRQWEKQDRKNRDWGDAYKIKSKHYRIKTNVPRFIMELEIEPFLDELYKTYVKVFKEDFGLKGKAADNKFINIHYGFESYRKHEDRPRSNPGFIRNSNELNVFYDDTQPDLFYFTTFHEGAHQFFAAMLPGADLPQWLNEALATYFEGCSYSRASKKITINHLPHTRLQAAQTLLGRAEPAPNLPESMFMNLPRSEFKGNQYALAWSFLYYLVNREQGKHRTDLAKLLEEMNGGGAKPVSEQFKTATRKDLGEIAVGWRDFVLALKAPPPPTWVTLEIKNAGNTNLRNGDILWSLDEEIIFNRGQVFRLLEHRDKNKPMEVRVVRRTADPDPKLQYRSHFVTVTIEPGAAIQLSARGNLPRRACLID